MTKKQAIWLAVIVLASAALLVALHLQMPLRASWSMNRVLHYLWDGVAATAALGGMLWLVWPRGKARRKDEDRERARRRVYGMIVVVILAVCVILFAEMRRESVTRALLGDVPAGKPQEAALADLAAISNALTDYAAANGGTRPASMEELVPKYLDRERLFYAYRDGPNFEGPPPDAKDAPAAPSYVLVKILPVSPEAARGRREDSRVSAYLRPGCGWAPLTAVLDKDGRVFVASNDVVRLFEERAR